MVVDAVELSDKIWEGKVGMLISQDLMHHLAVYVKPPAQLCLIRVIGSDHEYVFRVRYGDAHLDFPCAVPLCDSARKAEGFLNMDELRKFCEVASAMVVPPGVRPSTYHPYPQVLSPMSSEQFHYWQ